MLVFITARGRFLKPFQELVWERVCCVGKQNTACAQSAMIIMAAATVESNRGPGSKEIVAYS
jgi:hypothetical protein